MQLLPRIYSCRARAEGLLVRQRTDGGAWYCADWLFGGAGVSRFT